MSQLTGTVKVDISGEMTFAAAMNITATQQNRRKVLWEIAERNSKALPRISVELDQSDYLSVVAEDPFGRIVRTKGISPLNVTYKMIALRFTSKPGITPKTVDLTLWLDGLEVARISGPCDLSCNPELIDQSIGASLSGKDPATFMVYSLFCIDRIPDPSEMAMLDKWMMTLPQS